MEKKQAIRYFALVQALYYASTGLWNYLNIYLREIGFTPRQLGNVSAVGILAAMIVLPLMGILADKIRSPKKLFTWFLAMMLPLLLLYPAMDLAGVTWLMPYMVLTVAMVICTRVPAAFLESCGIPLTEESEGRMYPASYLAAPAVDAGREGNRKQA